VLYAFIPLILFLIILTSRIAAVYNLSKTAIESTGSSKTFASAYYLASSSAYYKASASSAFSKASEFSKANLAASSAANLAASSAANIAATSLVTLIVLKTF